MPLTLNDTLIAVGCASLRGNPAMARRVDINKSRYSLPPYFPRRLGCSQGSGHSELKRAPLQNRNAMLDLTLGGYISCV